MQHGMCIALAQFPWIFSYDWAFSALSLNWHVLCSLLEEEPIHESPIIFLEDRFKLQLLWFLSVIVMIEFIEDTMLNVIKKKRKVQDIASKCNGNCNVFRKKNCIFHLGVHRVKYFAEHFIFSEVLQAERVVLQCFFNLQCFAMLFVNRLKVWRTVSPKSTPPNIMQ